MQQLILDALSRPKNAVFRGLAESLREVFPERYLLQAESSQFDAYEFAEGGHCELCESPEIASDWDAYYLPRQDRILRRPFNTWLRATWEGDVYEIVTIGVTNHYRELRTFVLGPDRSKTERFYAAVCRWCTEVRGEVLVFSGGCWSKSKELHDDIRDASFDNLVLAGDLKRQIREDVRGFFDLRDVYERHRIPWKRGILLIGPPGNGKTHTVKALVNSLAMPCLYVRSFKSEYGTDQGNIQRVFQRARDQAPCVLVLEDLDALVNDGNRSYFLNELDGFASNSGILSLATTNHPERLDPALLERPSRFDRKYAFSLPEPKEREAYIVMSAADLAEPLRLSRDEAATLARATEGFSFAYLKELFVSSMMAWASAGAVGSFYSVLSAQVEPLSAQISAGLEARPERPIACESDDEDE